MSVSEDRWGSGVDKVKMGVASKFSGELKTLQMGAGSHINSVCFPFVSLCLQMSFSLPHFIISLMSSISHI